MARDVYGVVVDPKTFKVDEKATTALRTRLKAKKATKPKANKDTKPKARMEAKQETKKAKGKAK
jgi:hypothetical protein